MLIQCPSCGLQAKLPDSKEGAKVRCSECERVYVARPAGARARQSKSNPTMPIVIGAAVVVVAILIFAMSGEKKGGRVATPNIEVPEVAAKQPYVDPTGWDSPLAKTARRVHELAASRNELDLQGMIDLPHAWAWKNADEEGAMPDPSGFASLSTAEKSAFANELIAELTGDGEENLVGMWKPTDGSVIAESDTFATVQFELAPLDTSKPGLRGIHWGLVEENGKWRAWKWERWISEAEMRANFAGRTKKTVKKTLSDGSQVLESEPRVLQHDPTTAPELAARIDELVEKLEDVNLRPGELNATREELETIGKPATPILINGLYRAYQDLEAAKASGGDEYDAQVRLTAMAKMLKDITGYSTTVALESLGGTSERLDSGIKQWFYWYDKKYRRFDGVEEEELTDGLEEITDMSKLTEKERREYEKAKREAAQDD